MTSDGLTILDNNGTPVPAGWMPDKYFVGSITSDSYSNNAGDDSRTHEWGIALEAMHDKSWVEPIEWIISDTETYPNASLKPYTDTDNPTNTVRDQNVGEEAEPSNDDTQYAYPLDTTPPEPE
ncbi:hypothetical protein IW492_05875 [Enterococcus sp. BWB1-3]|uniref:hypothetical protein n=1 Tax=Enterococcus sp. BWB1-3 TaxID=2787713 RepID=UPI0019205407|nr:hypothetical protein [Enterococcus sp. BWB1-3]MBL1228760.1 hypothetical protein [Enterococcus sp. BWB1-3]